MDEEVRRSVETMLSFELKGFDTNALLCTLAPEIIEQVGEILQSSDSYEQYQCGECSSAISSISSYSSMQINHDVPDKFLQKSNTVKFESLYQACVPFLEKCKLNNQRQKLKQRIRKNIHKTLIGKIECIEPLCCLESEEFQNQLEKDVPNDKKFHKQLKNRVRKAKIEICPKGTNNNTSTAFFRQMISNDNEHIQESLQNILNKRTGRLKVADIVRPSKEKKTELKTKLEQLMTDIDLLLRC